MKHIIRNPYFVNKMIYKARGLTFLYRIQLLREEQIKIKLI